jgi:hypothetical protein
MLSKHILSHPGACKVAVSSQKAAASTKHHPQATSPKQLPPLQRGIEGDFFPKAQVVDLPPFQKIPPSLPLRKGGAFLYHPKFMEQQ